MKREKITTRGLDAPVSIESSWIFSRAKLKSIKHVERDIEMILDQHVSDVKVKIQFVRDTQIYGLFEAVLYLRSHLTQEAVDQVKFDILTQKGVGNDNYNKRTENCSGDRAGALQK